MNLNYMLAGVSSTNPMMYTIALLLLFSGSYAYAWGVDRWFLPLLLRRLFKRVAGSGADSEASPL